MDLSTILQQLTYRKVDIRFFIEKNVEISAWPGAVLRNRFLYTAESILCADGVSLRQHINTIPLVESHPFYNQFKGGFPKGFFFDCSSLSHSGNKLVLRKDRIYQFSLILVGSCIDYYPFFLMALERMFADGIGKPRVSLKLVDCSEVDFNNFDLTHQSSDEKGELSLIFNTPVALVNATRVGDNGYQNKLNNFPSFYQFIRSFLYRLLTLEMLYICPDNLSFTPDAIDSAVESYIADSCAAFLTRADLTYTKIYSTPRVGANNVYVMSGYLGTLSFDNVSSHYLRLLQSFYPLSVGNDINFGLGNFSIKTKQ